MPIPGPSAVAGLAVRGIGSGLSLGLQLISLPTRVVGIVNRTEDLLTRVEVVTRRIEHVSVDVEAIANRANGVVLEIRSVVDGARSTVAASAATVAAIDPLLERTGETLEQAAHFAKLADGLIGDGERMLGQIRPVVERALPPARRFVEHLSDHEVDAAIAMVDELPELAHRWRTDIMPILATLDGLAPNVEELVKLTDDVRQAILGIPGFRLLRRRGAEKLEEEDAEAAEEAEAERPRKRAVVTKVEDPNEPRLF